MKRNELERDVMGLKDKRVAMGAGLMAILLGVAGCGSGDASSARDFNELIPRMVGAVKDKTPEQAAASLFNVTSPDERRDAIAYLQTKPWGHEKPYMDAYKVLVTDPHPMVRGQAYRALGTSRDPSVVEILVKGLDNPDATVRRDAAYALQTTYSDKALDALALRSKGDSDAQVRINATKALGNSRNPKAIQAMITALDDEDAAVIHVAWNNLKHQTGKDFPKDDSRAWMTWYTQAYGASTQPK